MDKVFLEWSLLRQLSYENVHLLNNVHSAKVYETISYSEPVVLDSTGAPHPTCTGVTFQASTNISEIM